MTAMTLPPQGALTDEQTRFTEEWESVSPATQWVSRTNLRGEDEPFEVKQGDRFFITTRDRILTSHKVKEKRNNPFSNGSFRPIVVPEEVNVETNPNAMSDDEILSVFKSSDIAWTEWMKVIDSPATIQRMVFLADEHPQAQISHRRYKDLVDRFREVHPKASVRSSDEELNKFLYNERSGGIEAIGKPKQRPGGGFTGSRG